MKNEEAMERLLRARRPLNEFLNHTGQLSPLLVFAIGEALGKVDRAIDILKKDMADDL